MKTDYKKAWIKLRKTIKDDLRVVDRNIFEKSFELNAASLGEAIEYVGMRVTYEFLLKAMDELQGKKHHNIFKFKNKP